MIDKPTEELTGSDIRKLEKDPDVVLWELHPDLFKTDIEGNFVLKKDGTPSRKMGKRKGTKSNYHSEVRAKMQATKALKAKQKAKEKLEQQLRNTRKSLKTDEKNLKALSGKGSSVTTPSELNGLPQSVREDIAQGDATVSFRANEGPQESFLASGERQVLYGGAAGGGKSFAMLVDPLRYAHLKGSRALLIRRTMPELRELIDKSHELYPIAFPGAKFKVQNNTWTFPSGSKLEFGHCERDSDVYRYQGQAYTWIGFDELTQWPTAFCWNYLFTRLRSVNEEIPTFMRATANPGGVGGHWVKKMFIDPSPANESFSVKVKTSKGDKHITRKFIPALLSDNPYLDNGDYESVLASMPEVLRKQLLEGNWDVVEGAAFPEFNEETHVIPPFEIPAHWERLKGVDYGYASESACIWAAVDPSDGTLIIYRELYKKGLTGETLGAIMREMEIPDVRSVSGVLDTAAWSNAGGGYKGPTVGEVLVRQGHKLRRADKNRKAGKVQVHERLSSSHTGRPKMMIFSSCPNLIRELQSLPTSKTDPEDVDTHAQDHAYDALRYLIMSRPRMEGHRDRLAAFKSEYREPADSVFGY